MAKKVSFSKPARTKQANLDVDNWIATGGKEETTVSSSPKIRKAKKEETTQDAAEVTTRFTIDIPTNLHARIKAQCALRRVKMKDEIQTLLETHFA